MDFGLEISNRKMIVSKKEIKHVLEVYHPYVGIAVVGALLVGKATGVPGVDKFFSVAYQTTRHGQIHYSKGYDDAYLLVFLVSLITLLRFLYRNVVLEPIARKLKMSAGLTAKFIEAGWFGLYYVVVTTWGYFIFRDEQWWFNTRYMWDEYPHPIDLDMKIFYLASLSFWLQSLLSFSFEPPRKDDVAMAFHHFLTVSLISCSYLAGFVRVGAAILMQQNAGDIIYYHSKAFKYCKLERLSTIGWISFLVVWVYTRHIVFAAILYSLWTSDNYINFGWRPEEDHYFNDAAFWGFFIGLMLLQFLMIFWFFMIIKVAFRVLIGQGELKDTTEYSDDEVEESKSSDTTKPYTKKTQPTKTKPKNA